MRVTVLGSSGTYPAVDNPASSFLITGDDAVIWCDAGPGSFQQLIALVDPADLDAIVLSHRHPDHCIDVLAAYHSLAFRPDTVEPVPLYLEASVVERLSSFLGESGEERFRTTFDVVPLEDRREIQVGDVTVTPIEMNHSAPAFGTLYRSGGRSVFYTGDTGRGAWERVVGSVDLLICEASFQSGSEPADRAGHLTAGHAGRIASEIGAARLLLTHIPPHLDPSVSVSEAQETFGGAVEVAAPGASHEV